MDNVSLNLLTEQQARQFIREELQNFFSEFSIKSQPDEPKLKVVDLDGLLKARPHLGSRSTIYKKVHTGLPHSKQGKKLYFDLDAIDQWLLENSTKSISTIQKQAEAYTKGQRK